MRFFEVQAALGRVSTETSFDRDSDGLRRQGAFNGYFNARLFPNLDANPMTLYRG
ncbi:hypothetical protein [Nonomuraea sp. NPDC050643]|uniref:hypothetical protein n=1 Tax=Nonomuraea sp. NPDC050643 TaxID=3155660 RepID=UPI0033C34F5F